MEFQIDAASVWRMANKLHAAKPIVREEMLQTATDAAFLVANRAKVNAPYKTGKLVSSITANVRDAGGTVIGTVSAGQGVPYAKWVIDGTRAHVIVPVNKKALYWPGARHPVRRVNHPGTKANPFLRRAVMESRQQVIAMWRKLPARVAARMGFS